MKGVFHSRKFRQGSMATAITVIVVAVVVVVNLVATTLTDRYSLTADLTPTKVFSITDETKDYLAGLEKDVTIYILNKEESFSGMGEYYSQALEVLKKYTAASEHISLEFVDLMANPTFAQRFPSLQLTNTSIVIACGDKARDVTVYDLYNIESDYYGNGMVTSSKAEQTLTSALLAVTSEKSCNVAVITGHNEEDASVFTSLLQSNNYFTESVNLVTSEIDAALYDIAVIVGPQRDLGEDELKRLDVFLENGGRYGKTLLYFAPIEQTATPNLAAFLADWGVEVGAGMLYETDANRYMPGNPYIAVVDYAEGVFSENVQAQQQVALAAFARPLTLLFDNKNNITTSVLLRFSSTAGLAVDENDIREPDGTLHPFMTMSRHTSYDGTTPLQSQVLVAGSSAFLDQTFMSSGGIANSAYLLDTFAALTGREESIHIEAKDLTGEVLNVTAGQALGIGAALAAALPLVVLVSGLVIWGRRRHR